MDTISTLQTRKLIPTTQMGVYNVINESGDKFQVTGLAGRMLSNNHLRGGVLNSLVKKRYNMYGKSEQPPLIDKLKKKGMSIVDIGSGPGADYHLIKRIFSKDGNLPDVTSYDLCADVITQELEGDFVYGFFESVDSDNKKLVDNYLGEVFTEHPYRIWFEGEDKPRLEIRRFLMKDDYKKNLNIQHGDIVSGDGISKNYDLVNCVWTLPWLDRIERKKAIQNLVGYVKDGGHLITEEGVYQISSDEVLVRFDPKQHILPLMDPNDYRDESQKVNITNTLKDMGYQVNLEGIDK
ncbi:MAG: hypothetical protein GOU98_02420 [Candidatus Altiarchaeota archaeon]|nr:hypothetical protein [Candidatus Altiarchaeota archaeon]